MNTNDVVNAQTVLALVEVVDAYLASIGELERSRGETYAETSFRLGGNAVLEMAETRWFELE